MSTNLTEKFLSHALRGSTLFPHYGTYLNEPVISLTLGGHRENMPVAAVNEAVVFAVDSLLDTNCNYPVKQMVAATLQLSHVQRQLGAPAPERVLSWDMLARQAFTAIAVAPSYDYPRPGKRMAQIVSVLESVPQQKASKTRMEKRFAALLTVKSPREALAAMVKYPAVTRQMTGEVRDQIVEKLCELKPDAVYQNLAWLEKKLKHADAKAPRWIGALRGDMHHKMRLA